MNCMICVQGNHHVYVNNRIGGGSFGEVFTGTYIGRDVAVKFVYGGVEGRPMFQQEVSIWSSLRHHNIAEFIGSTCDMSRIIFRGPRPRNVIVCCMVSEYYPRGSVPAYYLSRHRILSMDDIRSIALDVARGLSYLHDERGIIHGDVKPSNLLVDSNGTVKIADFGKSHWAARYDPSQVGGDIHYVAPEVISHGKSSTKADVYSFGITLRAICHSQRPYLHLTPQQISQEVLQNVRPHISRNCPRRFASLMRWCWHANPGYRPSMNAVVNVLNSMGMLPG